MSNDLEDELIGHLDKNFGKAAKDYAVKESTSTPFTQIVIELTVYNYFVVRLAVEKNTIFFSIIQSGFQMPLLKAALAAEDLDSTIKELDEEIRLRIPDKYLQAKGW